MSDVDERLAGHLVDQAGVVSREQALAAGLAPHDLKRLLRRRELSPLHRGVYLDHTGEPSWVQHAWGAVLHSWPAALAGASALRAAEGPGSTRGTKSIEVAISLDRRVNRVEGVEVRRVAHLEERVLWHVGPPRMRYEEAALDVAAEAPTDLAALAELSRGVQGRMTTAGRLLLAAQGRKRLRRRRWIESVLEDVSQGVCSVLERGYVSQVERPHGLSGARRQVRDRPAEGVVYRDVEYDEGVVVELDGRLFHDTTRQRERDMDRDLVTATLGKTTVRLSYGQVYERSCWTAGHLITLRRARGWRGDATPCSPGCRVA